jgi:hypothetical protein
VNDSKLKLLCRCYDFASSQRMEFILLQEYCPNIYRSTTWHGGVTC